MGDVAKVRAKCVQCGHKRLIGPNEVPAGMMPTCDRCMGIMIADRAEAELESEGQRRLFD